MVSHLRIHSLCLEIFLIIVNYPKVFEGCFNPRIKFTRDEWDALIVRHFDASQPSDQIMRCVARVPDFIRRGKMALSGITTDGDLVNDMRETCEDLKSVIPEFRTCLADLEKKRDIKTSTSYLSARMQSYTFHQRLYGLALTVGLMLNIALSSIDVANMATLQAENEDFVAEILSIWRNIANYKPVGSGCLQLYMNMAWAGTSSMEQRQEIERILEEMENEFVSGNLPRATREELVDFENHLRLQDVAVFSE